MIHRLVISFGLSVGVVLSAVDLALAICFAVTGVKTVRVIAEAHSRRASLSR